MAKTKFKEVKGTIGDEFEGGTSDVEGLKEEMENWRDGLQGTNLENSDKFQQIEDAIDLLDRGIGELEAIEIPDEVTGNEVIYNIVTSSKSRATRLSNAIAAFRAIAGCFDEDSDYIDLIDSAITELENVDFPTMFS